MLTYSDPCLVSTRHGIGQVMKRCSWQKPSSQSNFYPRISAATPIDTKDSPQQLKRNSTRIAPPRFHTPIALTTNEWLFLKKLPHDGKQENPKLLGRPQGTMRSRNALKVDYMENYRLHVDARHSLRKRKHQDGLRE